jgi:hypothetical protein
MSEKFIPCGTDENLEGGHWVGQKAPELPTFKGNWTPPTNYLMELTLRDYFAGLALQGRISNPIQYQVTNEHIFARDAYVVADAMLKAREAKNG